MRVEKRKKLVEVEYNVYIAEDGKEFQNKDLCTDYEKRKEGTRITCPSCNGKGVVTVWTGSIVAYWKPEAEHSGAPIETECERCKGKGYLDKHVETKWT